MNFTSNRAILAGAAVVFGSFGLSPSWAAYPAFDGYADETLYAVTDSSVRQLVKFQSRGRVHHDGLPTQTNDRLPLTTIGSLSGIVPGQNVKAIDFRPSDGQLYALSTSGKDYSLYIVNLNTAALTLVGGGTKSGNGFAESVKIEFNPVDDYIRITDQAYDGTATYVGYNARINPVNGSLIGEDSSFHYNSPTDPNQGSVPFLKATAYRNSRLGATETQFYGYEFLRQDRIVLSDDAGSGDLYPQTPNYLLPFFFAGHASIGLQAAMDISGETDSVYLAFRNSSAPQEFYRLRASDGFLWEYSLGFDQPLLDMSVYSPNVFGTVAPEPTSLALILGVGPVLTARRRRG